MVQAGDRAPTFDALTQGGQSIKLDDYRGRKVALYFYPKDNTKGCTTQACNLRDHMDDLADAGIQVIGVSVDSVASHDKFATKYDLNFPLVSDESQEIVEAYGVWQEKKMYGKTYMGTVRTTFLINELGIVDHIVKKPMTKEHAEEILSIWTTS